jgi:RNA polymerase sigma-70 factor (ECF subfamily)
MAPDSAPHGYTTHATLLLRLNTADTRGRELAWNEFRAKYAPVIAGFANNLGVPRQEIDDVIQDVLLGFYSYSPTFVYDPAKGRFRGYLKVCTIRAVRTRRGKQLKFKSVPLDQVQDEDLEIDQVWKDIWRKEHLNRAIEVARQLHGHKPMFKTFEKYVINGEDAANVATEMGITVNAVYKAKERIALVVREQLEALEREEG